METCLSCTAQREDGTFCDRPPIADAPFPICPRHALDLYNHMTDVIANVRRDPTRIAPHALRERDLLVAQRSSQPEPLEHTVYYLLIDGVVKIGYASNLKRRLASYPPSTQVLATEPGDRTLEAQRLAQFADYLTAGREWFTPGPRLRAHIEALETYQAA